MLEGKGFEDPFLKIHYCVELQKGKEDVFSECFAWLNMPNRHLLFGAMDIA